ncbi:hypothetical protein FISHEDRAFT_69797 [Fistulina hepatica ATCC 64428]|uniref:Uncharacterized protein n=1 Tax=Fistulina hepatica ATCC 64428 TaxID=1128425 RepID=A0A0D7AKU5_9AGAR|nr:hypothetical protein FISHEDRAFT_69797 [Fistulina hepatica ATCC 64428]
MVLLSCYLISHCESDTADFLTLDPLDTDEIAGETLRGLAGLVDRNHRASCFNCPWRSDPTRMFIVKEPLNLRALHAIISMASSPTPKIPPLEEATSVEKSFQMVMTTPGSTSQRFILLCSCRPSIQKATASHLEAVSSRSSDHADSSGNQQATPSTASFSSQSSPARLSKGQVVGILKPSQADEVFVLANLRSIGNHGLFLSSVKGDAGHSSTQSCQKFSFHYPDCDAHLGDATVLVNPKLAFNLLFSESLAVDKAESTPSTAVLFIYGYDMLGKTAFLSAFSLFSEWHFPVMSSEMPQRMHRKIKTTTSQHIPPQLCLTMNCPEFDTYCPSSSLMVHLVSSVIHKALVIFLSEKCTQIALGLGAKDAFALIDYEMEGRLLLEKVLRRVRETYDGPIIVTVDNFDTGILPVLLLGLATDTFSGANTGSDRTLIHSSIKTHLLEPLNSAVRHGFVDKLVFSCLFKDVISELESIFGSMDPNLCNGMSKPESPSVRFGLSIEQAHDLLKYLDETKVAQRLQRLREYAGGYFDSFFSQEYLRLDFVSEFTDHLTTVGVGEVTEKWLCSHPSADRRGMTPTMMSALASLLTRSHELSDHLTHAAMARTPFSVDAATYKALTSYDHKIRVNDLVHYQVHQQIREKHMISRK